MRLLSGAWVGGHESQQGVRFLLILVYIVATIKTVFVWDEAKRRSNLEKHGLDFKDAHVVYDDPDKLTYDSSRIGERRLLDLAFAMVKGKLLALIYTERGDNVRVISFRPASREEREQYEQDKD
jgi:uncharacterized DUF497 family protein